MFWIGGVGARGVDGAVDRLGAGPWRRSAVVPSVRAAAAAAPKPGAEAAAATLPRPAAAPPLTRYAYPPCKAGTHLRAKSTFDAFFAFFAFFAFEQGLETIFAGLRCLATD